MIAIFMITLDSQNVSIENGIANIFMIPLSTTLKNQNTAHSIANIRYMFVPAWLITSNHNSGIYSLTIYSMTAFAMILPTKCAIRRNILAYCLYKTLLLTYNDVICIHICLLISSSFMCYIVCRRNVLEFSRLCTYVLHFYKLRVL